MEDSRSRSLFNDLRHDFLSWMLVPLFLLGFVFTTLDMTISAPRMSSFVFRIGICLLTLVGLVWYLRQKNYDLGAWVLSLGFLAVVWLAWLWFPGSNAQRGLVLAVIIISITVGSWSCLVVAACGSLVLVLGMYQFAAMPLSASDLRSELATLWGTVYLMCLFQHAYRTLVNWTWQGYEVARQNLEIARNSRLELKQALEDLALANSHSVRLNELLATARRVAEDARKAKEQFVASVSHELRTPLNMIIGFSEMILESPEVYARRLPAALLADVAAIKRNSQHLASLVDDILALCEVDAGRMQLFQEWASLRDIVAEAIEAVSALYESKGLSLDADIAEDLPAVHCDRTRVRQVILNLLSNAGRFTEQGGARVRASVQDEQLIVSIQDTGPGMDPDSLAHLFEPFQQADQSIRRRYGGTGLGLAISQRFIELHGGTIWLESQVGVGTTAFFSLPLRHSLEATPALTRWFSPHHEYTPRSRRSLAPQTEARPCVVILESGNALQRLIGRHTEDLQAISVPSLSEVAGAVEENSAIAVVINESESTGMVSKRMVWPRTTLDVPVLSCWVPELRDSMAQVGVQDYLVKPVQRADLLESLARVAPRAKSILLVDDDAETRQLFTRMLMSASRGYSILQAASGDAAWALLQERRPDVVLLDLVMANGDGSAFLEARKGDDRARDVPLIVVSAKDPERQPTISPALTITRQDGLSAEDLVRAIRAVTQTLQVRFAAPVRAESAAGIPAC
jgi:signal transduction histidine kinase/CheY-like chemotaxis protein